MPKVTLIHHNDLIMLHLTHQKKRKKFSTGIRCKEREWSKKTHLTKNDWRTNDLLRQIIANCNRHLRPFEWQTACTAIRREIDQLTGRVTFSGEDFYAVLEDYKAGIKSKVSKATINKFTSLAVTMRAFRPNLQLSEIDAAFFEEWTSWMQTRKFNGRRDNPGGMLNSTIRTYVSKMKQFLVWCKEQGHELKPDYLKFHWQNNEREINYLTEDELMAVYNFQTDKEHLAEIRDVFCFACWTGLRYSDVVKLRPADVRGDSILIKQQKTGDEAIIPFNQYSRAIWDKWQGKLPVTNNPNSNLQIKDLLKLAGIDDPVRKVMFRGNERIEVIMPKYDIITFHDARRTFIILLLIKGVPDRVVMKMSGHSDFRSFQKYIKIADSVKQDYMAKAWG